MTAFSPEDVVVQKFVASMGGASAIFRAITVILTVATAWMGYKKGRSVWSALEMMALAAAFIAHAFAVFELRLGFSSFLLAKLAVAVCMFIGELIFNPQKLQTLEQLSYLLGFKSDFFHAAMAIEKRCYHYAFARTRESTNDADTDFVYALSPQRLLSFPKAKCTRTVGMAVQMREDTLLKRLELSGRCHDWAGLSIYALSANKFMSYGLVAWMRWLNWIALLVWVAFVLSTSLSTAQIVIDCFVAASTLLDASNLNTAMIKETNNAKQKIPFWLEVIEAGGLAGLLTLGNVFAPNWMVLFEFVAFLFTSFALSSILHWYVFPRIRTVVE